MSNASSTTSRVLAVVLCLFTAAEVNYPHLTPQTQLAVFTLLGLVLVFTTLPLAARWQAHPASRALDALLVLASTAVCAYVAVQNEPVFRRFWLDAQSLGDRAGAEASLDYAVGIVGLVVVFEAARRTVGPALPILGGLFLLYAKFGDGMPGWLFPHRGYDVERIVAQTFLHSQGVFGTALRVMFTYVFLFVVFGAILEATGGTAFVIERTRQMFRRSTGGPAKVAVLSSGLMGSLSGSAVANTATTGTFTIPLMRSAGFRPHIAAAIEAAASSGGALVPPVMGAGAYMMLEIVDPPVSYLQIVRAALLPAILYYLSIFLTVHYYARRVTSDPVPGDRNGADTDRTPDTAIEPETAPPPSAAMAAGWPEGLSFLGGLGALLAFLAAGFSVFRAVTLALVTVLVLAALHPRTRIGPRRLVAALEKAARGGAPLIAAAASVGVVIGVVTLTGVGSKLPATLLPLAEQNLFLALLLLMVSSIVLGMGLPSAVCYLLLATLIGPALKGLGVVPLAAHLFIFYFGLMSMVTPPVALAGYTAASIAGSGIMRTSVAAFRFALIGFVLPFVFVYRPQLLMMTPDGSTASFVAIAVAFLVAAGGIVALAGTIAGHLRAAIGWPLRALLAAIAIALLWPDPGSAVAGLPVSWLDIGALTALVATLLFEGRRASSDAH